MNDNGCPIQSCPTEILQDIFKYVTLSVPVRLWPAMILSHTCWSWRRIALDMPYLWTHVRLRLKLPFSTINHYWSEIIKRAQQMPLFISIFPDSKSFLATLPTTFTQVHFIDTLSIISVFPDKTEDQKRLKELFQCQFSIPQCPIRRFELIDICGSSLKEPWHIDKWLKQWSLINEIRVSADFGLQMDRKTSFPHVEYLHLSLIEPVDLYDIVEVFPNLRELKINNICESSSHIGDVPVVMPFLKILELNSSLSTHWRGILCPNISTLGVRHSNFCAPFYKFIKSHPSIQHLQLDTQDTVRLRELSAAVAAAKCLEIRSDRQRVPGLDAFYHGQQSNRLVPIFPKLEHLIIHGGVESITRDEFNTLVISRFLPADHPDSRLSLSLNHPVKLLTLKGNYDQDEQKQEPEWRGSHLFESATDFRTDFVDQEVTYEMSWIR